MEQAAVRAEAATVDQHISLPAENVFMPINNNYYYYTSLTPSSKTKRRWGFGMPRHQLDHMQTICTSLQADNHTNTSSINSYRVDALPDAQPTVSKH